MDIASSQGMSDDGDDRVAKQAAAFDKELAAGRDPLPLSNEEPEDLSGLRTARASLRLLERVWPRAGRDEDDASGPLDRAGAHGDAPSVEAPTTFGRFRVVRELGQGGFGVVFLAIDPELNRPVALKVPRPGALLDPEARARFVREARAVAGLDHPNIVPLYEAGEVGPVCYLASAYFEGPTLAAWLRDCGGAVPPRRAAEILVPLADAMRHAHERGVLHRDLKPANVLLHRLTGDERDVTARIIDFGLARLMDQASEEATASFAGLGSAPFMATEQAEGKKVGPAADVYGLGAVLYAMLCGRAPHRGGNDLETLRRVVADEPAPPRRIRPEIPRDLEAICLKCLEKVPARRYPTARALAEDLGRFLAGAATKARPVSAPARAWRAVRRRPVRFGALALVGALAVAGLFAARRYEARLAAAWRTTRARGETIERDREALRRAQYLADVRLAAELVRNNQAGRAIELLERNRPRPGEADLREFAWYLLMGRCRTERRALGGHRGDDYHVEFSPDGKLLASAGGDGTIRIWDASSWRLVRTIAASETEVNAATFSPDGATLASVDDRGELTLWEVPTGRCRRQVHAHDGEALNARFTRDGTRIVTAGREGRSVKVWSSTTGELLGALTADGFILAPGGAAIATLGEGGEVDLHDLSTGKHESLLRFSGGTDAAAFSHDGKWLATAHGSDLTVRLWDVAHRRLRHVLRGHTNDGFSIVFTPDDRTLISVAGDGTLRLWDLDTGRQRGAHLGHTNRIWDVAVSPDGRTIASASGDETVRLWDPEMPAAPIRSPASGAQLDLAFSPDGRDLVGIGTDWVVSTWDAATGRQRSAWRITADGAVASAVLSADGRAAALRKQDETIEVHDLSSRRLLGRMHHPNSSSLAFDADGRHLAVASGRDGGSLWTVPEMGRLASLEGDVRQFLFALDGALLCTTEPGGKVISWRPADGRKAVVPGFEWIGYESAALTPNGRVFASGNWRLVRLRSLGPPGLAGEDIRLEGHAYEVRKLAFSPDGRTLASGDRGGVVKLWDVAAREQLLTFEPQSGPISAVRFSPDGRALATSGVRPDRTAEVFLWRGADDRAVVAAGPETGPGERRFVQSRIASSSSSGGRMYPK